MAMKRTTLLLVFLAGGALLGLLLFLVDGDGAGRSVRTEAEREAAVRAARAARQDGGGDASGQPGRADEATLKDLIGRYGGFSSEGRALLTRPETPGAGLLVTLSTSIDGWTVERSSATDATGRFALAELPRVSGYVLTIEGDRAQPFRLDVEQAVAGERHDFGDLSIDRYYFVVGRVVANGSHPVADASVAVTDPSRGGNWSFLQSAENAAQSDPVIAESRTDTDGKFTVRLEEPGIFSLRVEARDWATHYRPEIVVGVGDAKVDVALTRGEDIVGYVLDAAGRPVSESSVVLTAMARGRWWSSNKEITVTDGMGRFGFRVEPMSSRYTVRVVPPEGIDMSRTVEVPLVEDLIIRLPGTGVLTGRVVSKETQQPVAGAEVLLGISREAGGRGRMGRPDFSKALRTDAYGVFRVSGIGGGSISSFAVRAEGYEQVMGSRMWSTDRNWFDRIRRIELAADAEVQLPDVRLERGRVLAGLIKDGSSGRGIPGASVQVWDFVMGNRTTITDGEGAYRFDGIGDRVAMIVQKEGYAPFREMPWPGYSLEEAGNEAVRDIVLISGGTVEGRVRSGAGQPVVHALVRLRLRQVGRNNWNQAISLRDLYAYTDESGRYRIGGVPPLKLQAQVEAPGFDRGLSEEKDVKAGEVRSGFDVMLLPAASGAGRIVGRDGDPVAGARVTIARAPEDASDGRARWRALSSGQYAFTGDNGRFSIEEIPVGKLLIQVEAEEYAMLTETRTGVEPGEKISSFNFELAPAFVITGKVVNAQGEPITWCWVSARQTSSPDGEPSSRRIGGRVEADGSFRLANIAAGAYRIEVRVSNFVPNATRYSNLTMESVSAGTENLRLVLQPAESGQGAGASR